MFCSSGGVSVGLGWGERISEGDISDGPSHARKHFAKAVRVRRVEGGCPKALDLHWGRTPIVSRHPPCLSDRVDERGGGGVLADRKTLGGTSVVSRSGSYIHSCSEPPGGRGGETDQPWEGTLMVSRSGSYMHSCSEPPGGRGGGDRPTLGGDFGGQQIRVLYALLLELLGHLSGRLLLADLHALLPPRQAAIQHLHHYVQPAPQIVSPPCNQ